MALRIIFQLFQEEHLNDRVVRLNDTLHLQ